MEIKEDLRIAKLIEKDRAKNNLFKCFVASKRGNNAVGKGADRSVILATQDGKDWYQFAKIWGKNNEERARKIVNN